MNNEQQTWILKPVGYKVRNEDANEFVEWRLLVVDGEEFQPITKGNFDALFQPFDVSGLTRQVEEIAGNFARSCTTLQFELDQGEIYLEDVQQQMNENKTNFAEQIVLLLLNQEGETK